MTITEFRGRWATLSNFSPCQVWYDQHIYGSVEHAYQAAKSLSDDVRRSIRRLPTPRQAKRAGGLVVLRPDWEAVKVDIMRELLQQKFAREPERSILRSTGDALLVEGNGWGDRFWGQCPVGEGQNWLGRLLMEIRSTL